uniref:Uncharacterized protein n=1 Tax=Arundo donax TaxID=35708 RepID=A0A0A9BD75_ARUDO
MWDTQVYSNRKNIIGASNLDLWEGSVKMTVNQ